MFRNRRGYFEVGIYQSRSGVNIGTLWRTAYQLGAGGIFTVGRRYSEQASDTTSAWKHVPMRHYESFGQFLLARPDGAVLVGVEEGGRALANFCHPERAIYLLGAEDSGLPPEVLSCCDCVLGLASVRMPVYNVAVAGSIVLYHRLFLSA